MPKTSFYFAFMTLLLTLALVLGIQTRGVPLVLQTNLENLPLQIAGYQGREDSFPQSVYDELNADLHVYRHYRPEQGPEIDLYLGYYGTAKGGRTGHNPYACLPGAGWAITQSGEAVLRANGYPDGVRVNYVVASKDGVHNVMLHWYHSAGDRVLATGLQQNIQRFKGRVFHNRNDGAFVRVSTLVREPEITLGKERIEAFAGAVLELLPKHWPQEG